MKLAVMQPYLFPYLGYFQLIRAVDLFVFLEEVTFIKQGWIARNRILVNGAPVFFSVPLAKASSFVAINETRIHPDLFPRWKRKFLLTLTHHYGRTPHFSEVFNLVQEILDKEPTDIAALAMRSVECCSRYLGIDTEYKLSSRDFPSPGKHGVERILAICRLARSDCYINASGGEALYDRAEFRRMGIVLSILKPHLGFYAQPGTNFVPGLSILDVLMRCSLDQIRSMLHKYAIE